MTGQHTQSEQALGHSHLENPDVLEAVEANPAYNTAHVARIGMERAKQLFCALQPSAAFAAGMMSRSPSPMDAGNIPVHLNLKLTNRDQFSGGISLFLIICTHLDPDIFLKCKSYIVMGSAVFDMHNGLWLRCSA